MAESSSDGFGDPVGFVPDVSSQSLESGRLLFSVPLEILVYSEATCFIFDREYLFNRGTFQ